ncbi:hypothetical protein ACWKSP_01780 [Micromonosporaceae bacterium Da 78-11]
MTSTPYGLQRPTMQDAYDTVHRVHGDTGPQTWAKLLFTTGLSGRETDDAAFERLLRALEESDPVSRMCAQAVRIRLNSHTFLAAAHTLARSTA